ncbi:MAG: cell division protein FtsL [Gammaproteobacteria bacterium]|nr:cell division protein FtsL [Gammaproteobacteria bacterium]
MHLNKNLVIWIASLMVVNACMAFAVVYAKQKSRAYHIEVSQLRMMADDMDIEWGRLQLEEGALSEYGRVARIASDKLGMRVPVASEVRLVLE